MVSGRVGRFSVGLGERLRRQFVPTVCAGVLVAGLAFAGLQVFDRAGLMVGDWLLRLAPPPVPPWKTALVLIDSSSINLDHADPGELEESRALREMAAGFPFSRSVYADAIERLIGAGARLILVDVMLVAERAGDGELKDALARHPGKVVLAGNYDQDRGGDSVSVVRFQMPSDTILPDGVDVPVGFVNFFLDADGVVRSGAFRSRLPGGREAGSFAAVALGILKGPAARKALPDSAGFLIAEESAVPDVRVPLWQIFSTKAWRENLRGGEVFRDRVVAIGASAAELHDSFHTPLGNMAGAGLHLGVLGAVASGALYQRSGAVAAGIAALTGSLLAFVAGVVFPRMTVRVPVWVGVLAAGVGASLGSLVYFGWMPPLFFFGFGFVASSVAGLGADFVSERLARRRARVALERYVSRELAGEILDRDASFLSGLGGERRRITAMFCDLRGFTARSERGKAEEIFAQLNEYFASMVDQILASGGSVDKFLGDGILAVWGTFSAGDPADDARAALECALEMKAALARLNELRASRGLDRLENGISLHSGEVLFGNIGTSARMEPTVIGDAVNLAARIEGLTKPLACGVLISAATARLTDGDFRPADLVRVVGRAEPVELFTIWPAEMAGADRDAHLTGIARYRAGEFAGALDPFARLAASGDGLARVYEARCRAFVTNPPVGWSGITEAESK